MVLIKMVWSNFNSRFDLAMIYNFELYIEIGLQGIQGNRSVYCLVRLLKFRSEPLDFPNENVVSGHAHIGPHRSEPGSDIKDILTPAVGGIFEWPSKNPDRQAPKGKVRGTGRVTWKGRRLEIHAPYSSNSCFLAEARMSSSALSEVASQ